MGPIRGVVWRFLFKIRYPPITNIAINVISAADFHGLFLMYSFTVSENVRFFDELISFSFMLVSISVSFDVLFALTETEGQSVKILIAQASAFLDKFALFAVRFKEFNLPTFSFFDNRLMVISPCKFKLFAAIRLGFKYSFSNFYEDICALCVCYLDDGLAYLSLLGSPAL